MLGAYSACRSTGSGGRSGAAVALDPDGGKVLEALAIVALLSGDASEARALVRRAYAVGCQVQPNLSKALEQPRDKS